MVDEPCSHPPSIPVGLPPLGKRHRTPMENHARHCLAQSSLLNALPPHARSAMIPSCRTAPPGRPTCTRSRLSMGRISYCAFVIVWLLMAIARRRAVSTHHASRLVNSCLLLSRAIRVWRQACAALRVGLRPPAFAARTTLSALRNGALPGRVPARSVVVRPRFCRA